MGLGSSTRGPADVGAAPPGTRAALAWAGAEIAAGGCQTPRLDAEILLAHVLGTRRGRLAIDAPEALDGRQLAELEGLVHRRAQEREPVAYIVGRRAFRGIELICDARALVPRPETELLVESALGLPAGARVLDVGTGSGAVALALASERPDLRVSGSDVSEAALELARANAAALAIEVRWLHSDLLESVPAGFDAILANLPYIAERERDSLAPEILKHEPSRALYGGPDGLGAIRALLRQLAARPPVGLLALEVGAGQADAVRELLVAMGLRRVRTLRDLAGIERVVAGEGRSSG